MTTLKINLNNRVRARVKSDALKQKLAAGGFHVSPVDGFVTLPLWELIHHIGGDISIGFDPPIAPTVTVYQEDTA